MASWYKPIDIREVSRRGSIIVSEVCTCETCRKFRDAQEFDLKATEAENARATER
jgi:hypothetical protein